MSIRAVVADPAAPSGLRLAQVEAPAPGPGHVLVEAWHVCLNRGDLAPSPAGSVVGRDVAGVVLRSAQGGPPVGARVVARATGAFAQRVAADLDALALVPDGVPLAEAAALPTAAVAAMQAFRDGMLATPTKGARLLVTGASGGVGRVAVQLAAYGGAHVIAVVGDVSRSAELAELGADEVVTDLEAVDEPVDLVLDTVGGPQLVAAWGLLAPGGNLQCVGASAGLPATFAPGALVGAGRTLSSFEITGPLGPDLAALVRLVDAGSLRVPIGWRGPLARVGDAAEALVGRRVAGKAVLDIKG